MLRWRRLAHRCLFAAVALAAVWYGAHVGHGAAQWLAGTLCPPSVPHVVGLAA